VGRSRLSDALNPMFLGMMCKTLIRIMELQESLILVLKNKPDDIKSIRSHEDTINELKRLVR